MGTVWFDDYPEISKDFKDLKIAKPPKILEAYWVDENGKKTDVLLCGSDKVGIYISGENLKNKKARLLILDSLVMAINTEIEELQQVDFQEENEATIYFDFTEHVFIKGEPDEISEFSKDLLQVYFRVIIEDELDEEFCNDDDTSLKVHVARYVPRVMKAQGWDMGAALQEEWFSRVGDKKTSNKPLQNSPVTDLVTMDWVLSFSRAKAVYDSILREKTWINEGAKNALAGELKRMGKEGLITLPLKEGKSTDFGVFDSTLVTYKHWKDGTTKSPTYDKYYFQLAEHSESLIGAVWNGKEVLDDLFAALGDFIFRIIGGGTITKKGEEYVIHITTLGIYVRDSFDFNDSWYKPNQPLGFWDITNKEVRTLPTPNYYYVSNKSYRNYRETFNMGEDFTVYSNIKYEMVDGSFNVPTSRLF